MNRPWLLLLLAAVMLSLVLGADRVLESRLHTTRKAAGLTGDAHSVWSQMVGDDIKSTIRFRQLEHQIAATGQRERKLKLILEADQLLKADQQPASRGRWLLSVLPQVRQSPDVIKLYDRLIDIAGNPEPPVAPAQLVDDLLQLAQERGVGDQGLRPADLHRWAKQLRRHHPPLSDQLTRLANHPEQVLTGRVADQLKIAKAMKAAPANLPLDAGRVEASLDLPAANPLDRPITADWRWSTPEGSGWRVEPATQQRSLSPGHEQSVRFNITYDHAAGSVVLLPALDVVVRDSEQPLFEQQMGLPVSLESYFAANPRTAHARPTTAPPSVDGKLDEPIWQQAPETVGFYSPDARQRIEPKTGIRFAYDAQALYVGVRMVEPDRENVAAVNRERDGRLWLDDCFEIFLNTDDQGESYQMIVNSLGAQWDSIGLDGTWNARWDSAVAWTDGAWTIEFAIPWISLGQSSVQPGRRVGLQMSRNRYRDGQKHHSVWSPCFEGWNHDEEYYGQLILD